MLASRDALTRYRNSRPGMDYLGGRTNYSTLPDFLSDYSQEEVRSQLIPPPLDSAKVEAADPTE